MSVCERRSTSLAADRPTAINLIYCNLPELSAGGRMLPSTSLLDRLMVHLHYCIWKAGMMEQSAEVVDKKTWKLFLFFPLHLCGIMWLGGGTHTAWRLILLKSNNYLIISRKLPTILLLSSPTWGFAVFMIFILVNSVSLGFVQNKERHFTATNPLIT